MDYKDPRKLNTKSSTPAQKSSYPEFSRPPATVPVRLTRATSTPSASPAEAAANMARQTAAAEPARFTRFDVIASRVKPHLTRGKEVAAETLKDIWSAQKGGFSALVGSELTTKQKAGAAVKAPVDLAVGVGMGLKDFFYYTVPQSLATGAQLLADQAKSRTVARVQSSPFLNDAERSEILKKIDERSKDENSIANFLTRAIDRNQKQQAGSMVARGLGTDTGFFDPKNFGYQVGTGGASIVAYAGTVALTKNPIAAAAMLGWVEGSGTYREAKQTFIDSGMDENKAADRAASLAFLNAGGIAALEKVGMDALFRNYAGGKLRNMAVGAITETLQETTQTVWSNSVTHFGYDKTVGIFDHVIETALVTLPIGFIGGGFQSADFDRGRVSETSRRVATSSGFDIDAAIAAGDIAAEDVYSDPVRKTLKPKVAEGRINDVAQKLGKLEPQAEQVFRDRIAETGQDLTLDEIVDTGRQVLEEVTGNTDPAGLTIEGGFDRPEQEDLNTVIIGERDVYIEDLATDLQENFPEITESEAREMVESTLDAMDVVAQDLADEEYGKTLVESASALQQDIVESVEIRGEEATAAALIENPAVGVTTQAEALEVVRDAMDQFIDPNEGILADIAEAEAIVDGRVPEPQAGDLVETPTQDVRTTNEVAETTPGGAITTSPEDSVTEVPNGMTAAEFAALKEVSKMLRAKRIPLVITMNGGKLNYYKLAYGEDVQQPWWTQSGYKIGPRSAEQIAAAAGANLKTLIEPLVNTQKGGTVDGNDNDSRNRVRRDEDSTRDATDEGKPERDGGDDSVSGGPVARGRREERRGDSRQRPSLPAPVTKEPKKKEENAISAKDVPAWRAGGAPRFMAGEMIDGRPVVIGTNGRGIYVASTKERAQNYADFGEVAEYRISYEKAIDLADQASADTRTIGLTVANKLREALGVTREEMNERLDDDAPTDYFFIQAAVQLAVEKGMDEALAFQKVIEITGYDAVIDSSINEVALFSLDQVRAADGGPLRTVPEAVIPEPTAAPVVPQKPVKFTDKSIHNKYGGSVRDVQGQQAVIEGDTVTLTNKNGRQVVAKVSFPLQKWIEAENGFGNPNSHKRRLVRELNAIPWPSEIARVGGKDQLVPMEEAAGSAFVERILDAQVGAIQGAYNLYLEEQQKLNEERQPEPITFEYGTGLNNAQNTPMGKVIKEIADARKVFLSKVGDYIRVESEGFMPLNIERINERQIAVSHTFVQNGDVMRDPEVVFNVTSEGQLEAVSYQNDAMGSILPINNSDSLLKMWAGNIRAQGFVKAAGGEVEDTGVPVEDNVIEAENIAEETAAAAPEPISDRTIEQVLSELTKVNEETREVELIRQPNEDDLAIIAKYTPAGGREKKGATGRGLLDEYFTPESVVTMVRRIIEKYGYNENSITLEPSAGTGNFVSILEKSYSFAYELNDTTAQITKIKYPKTKMTLAPFEQVFIDVRGNKKAFEPRYNFVVGNPPYGKHRGMYQGLGEEPGISAYELYFIKRALDLTKEGGYVAMVVPSSILRNQSNTSKKAIARLGKLVEAYRLPNGSFDTTDIGTDILVFKRETAENEVETVSRLRTMSDDNYFRAVLNNKNILGTEMTMRGRFGEETRVVGSITDAEQLFNKLFEHSPAAPEKLVDPVVDLGETEVIAAENEAITKASDDELGQIITDGTVASVPSVPGKTRKPKREVVKDALAEKSRRIKNAKKKGADKEQPAVIEQAQTKQPGEVIDLSKETGSDDQWEFVNALGELEGDFDMDRAYYSGGKWFNEFNYLQGDVYAKLDTLEADFKSGAVTEARYQNQKAKLEAIKPERITIDRINVSPNSVFARQTKIQIPESSDRTLAKDFMVWIRTLPFEALGRSNRSDIYGYVEGEPVRGSDKKENETRRADRRKEADRLFLLYLRENLSDAQKKQVEDEFNRRLNSYVKPDYIKTPLVSKPSASFKGANLSIRPVQKQGIGFLLNKGVGILAHDVGVGKTLQAIIANMELIERGWAKKPLIVVPNVMIYKNWVREIQDLYPGIKLNLLGNLTNAYDTSTGKGKKIDVENLVIEDGSLTIMTVSGFEKLSFSEETYQELTKDFQDVIARPSDMKTARAGEKTNAAAGAALGKARRGTTNASFENLGFDSFTLDEAHIANHIVGSAQTKKDRTEDKMTTEFRQMTQTPSQRGLKTWLATQYLLKKKAGRNVFLLSATPFTNHPLEYYSMLSLVARDRLEAMGIRNVNDFMTMFMEIIVRLEYKANGTFKPEARIRSFKNYNLFTKLLTEYIDFRDGSEAGVIRPERTFSEIYLGESRLQYDLKQMVQPMFQDTEKGGALTAIQELQKITFSPYASQFYDGPKPSNEEIIRNSPKLYAVTKMVAQSLKDNPDGGQVVYSRIGKDLFPALKQAIMKEAGLNDEQVAIISGDVDEAKRDKAALDFNTGKVKVLLGTETIHVGINLQTRGAEMYMLSMPWNYTDQLQLVGRIWRHGNKFKNIRINYLVTENTVDPFVMENQNRKMRMYKGMLDFKGDTLDVDDFDPEEVRDKLITDPRIKVKVTYEMKRTEVTDKRDQLKAKIAYENRQLESYLNSYRKYQRAVDYSKNEDGTIDEYWQRVAENAKQNLIREKQELEDRGIDIATIQTKIEAGEEELKKLEAQLTQLDEDEKKAAVEAEAEYLNSLDTVRETDIDALLKERSEEAARIYAEKPKFSGARLTLNTFNRLRAEVKKDIVSKQTVLNYLERPEVTMVEKVLVTNALDMYDGDKVNLRDFITDVEADLVEVEPITLQGNDVQYPSINRPDDMISAGVEYDEVIYTSPFQNTAGKVHFGSTKFDTFTQEKFGKDSIEKIEDNYFAHTRRETSEGNTFRNIIEVQSDLFQKNRLEVVADPRFNGKAKLNMKLPELLALKADYEKRLKTGDFLLGDKTMSRGFFEKELARMEEDIPKWDEQKKIYEKLKVFEGNWWQRIIREEIHAAARDGVTFLRFPTGVTAALVEGGTVSAVDWYDYETNVRLDTIQDIGFGSVIQRFNDYDTDDINWVVTEVDYERGTFRAAPDYKAVEAGERIEGRQYTEQVALKMDDEVRAVYFEKSDTELLSFAGVSEETAKNHPQYSFYQNKVGKYLKTKFGAKEYIDETGTKWWQMTVDKALALEPVVAFSRLPIRRSAVTGRFVSRKQALKDQAKRKDINQTVPGTIYQPQDRNRLNRLKEIIEWYDRRFGLSTEVDFADVIYTGRMLEVFKDDYSEKYKMEEAAGVYTRGRIVLSKTARFTTPHHEMVHRILPYIHKIKAFDGITVEGMFNELRKDKTGKVTKKRYSEYSAKELNELEEALAIKYEEYVLNYYQTKMNETMMERFARILRQLVVNFRRNFFGNENTIEAFYNLMLTYNGPANDVEVQFSDPRYIERVRRFNKKTGETIYNFGEAEQHRAMFQVIPEQMAAMGETAPVIDRTKRDINWFEKTVAQSRDIFLKDEQEFGAAAVYEGIAERRRRRKEFIDVKFTEILKPYIELEKGLQARVNQVLMDGDKDGKNYSDSELQLKRLTPEQIAAYKSVRKVYDVAHQLLLKEMRENNVPEAEIAEFEANRKGYMPHVWKHRFVVKTQKENGETWETEEMMDFKTKKEALAVAERLSKDAAPGTRFVVDTLDALPVDFFSEQRLSFEAMKNVINNAKTATDVKKQMVDALRNMNKEKGFGRRYLRRTGVAGYEQEDVLKITADYLSGLSGFVTKMEAAKLYYDNLNNIDARRQPKYYAWMRDMVAYDMGDSGNEWQIARTLSYFYYLANDLSYLLTNATQNWVVGTGELSKYAKNKLVDPEKYLIEATTSWVTGVGLTAEERHVIEGLLKVGELGGEMAAELTGFKNNPLYNSISSTFNKALYASTAIVEQNINRVPAFLAARRMLIAQGMDEKQANETAYQIQNDIHFRYGKQYRPELLRGRKGVLFIFLHYIRSLLFQLYRDVKRREFVAFTRKMLYVTALGGTASLPFAKLLVQIIKAFADDEDDEELKEEMAWWEQALKRGVPSLTGIDLSGRVAIDVFAIGNIMENPNDIKTYLGAFGALAWVSKSADEGGRWQRGTALLFEGRQVDAMGYLLPDFLANPVKAYTGYVWGVRSFAGNPLTDHEGNVYKYSMWEAIIRATGFAPTQEGMLWEAKSREWAADDRRSAERSQVRRTIQAMIQRGEYEEARAMQNQAIVEGTIDNSTNYVREFAEPRFLENALRDFAAGQDAEAVQRQLITDIFGDYDLATEQQRNNIRRKFEVASIFGTQNKDVNDILKAESNKDKAQILVAMRREMGEEAFNDFYNQARSEMYLESGSSVPVLISDDLDELFYNLWLQAN